ncbi:hypothetical protein APTSU1_000418800 [Apodemus speciosus]|uniref:Uncharacterized protein n=1 Tax=Apodemus speciosus TaxID=105296 RepID=A0ABQ0EPG1_APOSI
MKVGVNHFDTSPERNNQQELKPFSIWSRGKGKDCSSSSTHI